MKLPDVDRAPESDLSRLAVRFLADEDVTALTPIVDELIGVGRDADADLIRHTVAAQILSRCDRSPHSVFSAPDVIGHTVLRTLWYDLFTWEATVDRLIKSAAEESERTARAWVRHGSGPVVDQAMVPPGGYEMVSNDFMAGVGLVGPPPDEQDGGAYMPPQDELHQLIAALTPSQRQMLQEQISQFAGEDPRVDEYPDIRT